MKTVLITGSNKGIGFEVARQLGNIGFQVIISGRDEGRLLAATDQLRRENINADSLLMDVGEESSIVNAGLEIHRRKKHLDVLINNAAVSIKGDRNLIQDNNILTQTLRINTVGPLLVCRTFMPYLNTPGKIINISSGGGSMTDDVEGWSPAYCVSKSALNALTRHLAYELADKNICVAAMCPGWVKTDMGGRSAPRSVAQGADTAVWLATTDGIQSGLFYRDRAVIPW